MNTSHHRQKFNYRLLVIVLLLTSCAHMVNTLDGVKKGMEREQALEHVIGNPRPYVIGDGDVEYVLFRVSANLLSLYGDSPHDVLFLRFENGKVVDKGVVGDAEAKRIRKINPHFKLQIWQDTGVLPADQIRE